jgi:hypothetical protein
MKLSLHLSQKDVDANEPACYDSFIETHIGNEMAIYQDGQITVDSLI